MKLEEARKIANGVKDQLSPFCIRIEIAGSIRRCRSEVKDIEIVAIPKRFSADLFGKRMEVDSEFCHTVDQWKRVKGQPSGKYTQRILPAGIVLDLFMAHTDNWGLIYAIRTGSVSFSHHVLASGWVRAGFHGKNGMLWRNGGVVPVREEHDLFGLIHVPWIEPEKRI